MRPAPAELSRKAFAAVAARGIDAGRNALAC
jgi:hypothetical protein